MEIKQFEDKNLAHYSYAIHSNGEIALIDPARNPQPYYDFAKQHDVKITTVIETHPHADFVSSHLEIQETTHAKIYVSKLLGAEYAHQSFDDGDTIKLGNSFLKALNTPGHSPDSISIVAIDENGKEHAVFTGDTLFIGDCGRPDLREKAGAITSPRKELAKQMYHSLRNKLITLPDSVIVYPAHGAGSLCGKGLSEQNSSTIGAEKMSNWSLQSMSEEAFIQELLVDQPFIPKYFPFEVGINKKGAGGYQTSISKVLKREAITCTDCANTLNPEILIIDTRPQDQFKKAHLKNAINLMDDVKFETWLGSIVNPNESFYLIAENEEVLNQLIERTSKIGYENQIALAFVLDYGNESSDEFDLEDFKNNLNKYTIIDIRNPSEVKAAKIFEQSIHIPLYELRERSQEIPTNKPIVVHCAGGYRSAAGSSIIKSKIHGASQVIDLSEAVKTF
ncbi:MBL fold metallo-hydrolase [Fluviicola taffensis]|uniref:Metallo-beta-lactamase/rhodanese-like domain-containing protein n=1 Tax=Fluviicola taffensis (strain DSM 16823 / NCIMB 13979 / RW262) TaxID=755732 RepID=F2IHS0_FLUTR|nr:MBL fold metallo-hydrolase [Fluviicola taffensis]AEA44848.1 metallo-beta-lactamase/rhodanese-like domain-containing protein [Fluviicola taffensis DSM 16823]